MTLKNKVKNDPKTALVPDPCWIFGPILPCWMAENHQTAPPSSLEQALSRPGARPGNALPP